MKHFFLSLLTAVIFYCSSNAHDSLILRVQDKITALPIAGATIAASSQQLLTDNSGILKLPLKPTTSALRITASGYHAQTISLKEQKNVYEVLLQPHQIGLDEIVVSGTLRQVNRLQSPVPVESYTAHFFHRNRTHNLFDALSQVNGVQPQITCNVCNTGGLQVNGLEGPYTMVLIDGMPIVSALSTVYGLFGIPNNMIKRVEVIKGPASTLYGSEAVAGIINVITKAPTHKREWIVSQNATTYREWNTDIGYSFKQAKVSGMVSLNHFKYNHPTDRNADGFMDIPLQQRTSLFGKLMLDRKHQLPFSLAVRYISEERSGGQVNWTRKWRGSDSVYGESIDTRRVELFGNYGLSIGKQDLLLEYAYNYHHQDSWYGNTFYLASQHTAFAQLRWDKKIGSHALTAGVPFRFQRYDDNSVATSDAVTGKNLPALNTIAGFFVQDEWKLSEQFTALAGMRLEHHQVQGLVWSPRLSLKWNAAEHHTFRLAAGNGFRVVNLFTEDHAALTGARQLLIEERLKPERSWNAHLQYSSQYHLGDAGLLSADAGLFYTHFSNRILPDYDTDPEKIIYRNLDGFAVSRGGNAALFLSLRNGIRANAGVTILDAFVREEEAARMRILYVPTFTANYGLGYQFSKTGLTLDFTGRTLSPMRLPVFPNDYRPEMSPWYSILNLQLTKKVGDWLQLVVGVQNLLNFMPRDPIMRPFDPFDRTVTDPITNPNGFTFDPSYNYAPLIGRRFQVGITVTLR